MMVGSELPTPETAESTVTDQPVIEVRGLTVYAAGGASLGAESEPTAGGLLGDLAPATGTAKRVLDDVTFTIHAGEVMGIAGVEGNGQTELIDALIGLKNADSGTIGFLGDDITPGPPASAANRASATSPRTATATASSWKPRSGRTASSATSPRSPTRAVAGASGSTSRAPRPTPAGSSRSTTSALPASTSPPPPSPAATSRS